MTKLLVAFLFIGLLAVGTPVRAEAPATATAPAATQAALPKELAEAIEKGIKLLEAGKNAEVLDLLFSPAKLAKSKAEGKYDQQLKDFGEHVAPLLLEALKKTHEVPPVFAKENTEATYKVGTYPLIFMKEDGNWHIVN